VLRLDVYGPEELSGIVRRSAKILGLTMDTPASEEIARRSRGTPRIANRLLRRVRDFAQVKAKGDMSKQVAVDALDLLEVDPLGLDEVDRRIMLCILEKFDGGPVGLNTLSSAADEEAGTIEEVYEPYLIQQGFIDRTPRGRIATERAFDYFKVQRRRSQNVLF
jgi:holliday junction DNA helicase RuvB